MAAEGLRSLRVAHRTSAHIGSPIGLTQIVDQQLGRLSNELMHGVALQGGIVGEQPQAYQAPYHCTPRTTAAHTAELVGE
jgi:hypothetical protein